MHTITILHRILATSFPEIHTQRLAALLAGVLGVRVNCFQHTDFRRTPYHAVLA